VFFRLSLSCHFLRKFALYKGVAPFLTKTESNSGNSLSFLAALSTCTTWAVSCTVTSSGLQAVASFDRSLLQAVTFTTTLSALAQQSVINSASEVLLSRTLNQTRLSLLLSLSSSSRVLSLASIYCRS
jgi:hypothetical protein